MEDHCGQTATASSVPGGYYHWVEMVMVAVVEVLEDVSQSIINLATSTVIERSLTADCPLLKSVARELFSLTAPYL